MARHIRQGAFICTALLLAAAPACTGGPSVSPGATGGTATGGAVEGRAFTLLTSGDVLPHTSVIDRAAADGGGGGYDFRPMLAGAAPAVRGADLAICHMETVYGRDGGPYTGYPAFKSPPEVARALRATGYDSCSTASNHTLDDGAEGIGRTLDALDEAGIAHAGSARSAAEAARPNLLTAGRGEGAARVAQLAYTYGTNGIPLPDGRPWAVNLIDAKRIVTDARAARRAGADVVVVSVHWGTEWQDDPDPQQLTLARELTAAATAGRRDIDLVVGTHAHVPQAYEKVNGTWVVYGMGDQIAGMMVNGAGAQEPRGNQSSMARFTFVPPRKPGERWTVGKAEFLPQQFDPVAGRIIGPTASVRDRIRSVVLSRGAAQDGLVMGR